MTSSSSSSGCSSSIFLFHAILVLLHILSLQIHNTNSRSSSSHWKLVTTEDGRQVIKAMPLPGTGTGASSTPPDQKYRKPNSETASAASSNLSGSGGGSGGDLAATLTLTNKNKTDKASSIKFEKSNPRKHMSDAEEELVFQILTTTIVSSRGSWIKNGHYEYLKRRGSSCENDSEAAAGLPLSPEEEELLTSSGGSSSSSSGSNVDPNQEILDCGRHANFTYYDQLIGIANRQNHPHIPEPSVALLFRKKNSKKETIDLNVLERKLRKAKKEKPGSVQLYNQIGNFWRIKGHTVRAIECFRRALSVAPNNPEVLHNLARLLLYIGYLDDSLFLARRSLELQNDRGAWQQHFTLGEILKAYGHHQEALLHFKHTLELRPDHTGAQEALHELETLLSGSGLHVCTLLIIIFLVVGVLLVMLSSLDSDDSSDTNLRQPHRHFSRALAMRSLKLGISPRALRAKRLNN